MPPAVAERPRDERGYPVLAITPWADGKPRFAATGTARSYLCAVERRCSVCGTPMRPGPVWRVVSGPEADAIDAALDAGQEFVNRQPTVEAPGHRSCMLYAAVVCPYLSQPGARRGQEAAFPGVVAVRGDRRGLGGAVAGFDELQFRLGVDGVQFWFRGLREFRRHQVGDEQLAELAAAVAQEPPSAEAAPDYLLTDEDAASRQFRSYVDG